MASWVPLIVYPAAVASVFTAELLPTSRPASRRRVNRFARIPPVPRRPGQKRAVDPAAFPPDCCSFQQKGPESL